jgi:GxxExxY protein
MNIDQVTGHIVAAAVEVHRTLGGPGLLESVYEEALKWELEERSLIVEQQKEVPIDYKGNLLTTPMRLDLLVQGIVIVECKAVTTYNTIFEAQALTYLRLTGLHVALVINFGERMVKTGIHRVVNNYIPPRS